MLKAGKNPYNPTDNQHGVSILEMSIALIILIPLLFGIIQWGLILSASITIQNTASIAAREIVLITAPEDPVARQQLATTRVQSALDISPTLSADHLAFPILVDGEPVPQGVLAQPENNGTMLNNAWSVTINYDLPLIFALVVPTSQNGVLRITSRAVMQ